MASRYVVYHGKVYADPRGYNYEPHSWWDEEPLLQIKPWRDLALFWKYLIHLAIWEPEGREVWRKGDPAPVLVRRGQLYMGLEELGKRPGWNKTKVWRTLRYFENEGRIVTEARPRGTLITICNYDPYQDPDFYRETRKVGKSDKSTEKCNATVTLSKSYRSSGVRPPQKGASETEGETVTKRRRNANKEKSLDSLNHRGAQRNAGGQPPGRASSGAGSPEPERKDCTWEAIAKAIVNDFWTRFPEEVKPTLIAEAAASGPPPEELDPQLRRALLEEADRHGFRFQEELFDAERDDDDEQHFMHTPG